MPTLPQFKAWPSNSESLPTSEIIKLYESGFAGAVDDPVAKDRFRRNIVAAGGEISGSVAGAAFAGSGEGELVIPFVFAERLFPGCYPGPAQERGDCFIAGTTVLGERIKSIEQVEIGDKVWTGEGKLTTVISKRQLVTARPLIKIYPTAGLPITCTVDHKILVYRMSRVAGKRVNRLAYERAVSSRGRQHHRDAVRAVERCYESRQPTWVSAGELRSDDCILTPVAFEQLPFPCSPNNILDGDDGLFLLGYFLGDGHASGHGVELMAATEEMADWLERILASKGFRPSRSRQKGCWRVRVSSVNFVRWLREHFYDENKVKSFPGWAIGQKSFLDGLQAADGFTKGTANYLDSTSRSIIDGACATLVCLGYEPAVSQSHRGKGCYPNAKPIYRIIWRECKQKQYVWRDDSFVCRPIRRIEVIEGPTVVYDIGIADAHHSFIANGYAVHNCVSHGLKNAALITLACEIVAGKPDEVTGRIEGVPELSPKGITEGVLSSEWAYWWRGYNGDGWDCGTSCDVAIKHGIMLRKAYPELGIDLTEYSGSLAGKFGSRSPPESMNAVGREHVVRTATELESFAEVRDFLKNGYGIQTCGGEGFSSTRNEDGVSKRSGSWAHSMAYIGADDRDIAKQKYGEPLVLVQNSWGRWNQGSRKILGTNIEIPEGTFWALWSDVKRRWAAALSSVAGWPAKTLPKLQLLVG